MGAFLQSFLILLFLKLSYTALFCAASKLLKLLISRSADDGKG